MYVCDLASRMGSENERLGILIHMDICILYGYAYTYVLLHCYII
jgi:hypothetical protein